MRRERSWQSRTAAEKDSGMEGEKVEEEDEEKKALGGEERC